MYKKFIHGVTVCVTTCWSSPSTGVSGQSTKSGIGHLALRTLISSGSRGAEAAMSCSSLAISVLSCINTTSK